MKKISICALGAKFLAVALLLTGLAGRLSASEATLIALGTTNRVASPQGSPNWHYRLGSSEASSPVTAWRTNDFVEDGSWSVGSLPLGYATAINDPNNYEGTLVTTVPATTTCVYLRRTFVLTNRLVYSALTVSGFADDGAVVWINGRELAPRFQCCTGGTDANVPTFDALASTALESAPFSYIIPNDFSGPFVDGTNVLCIMLMNANSTSSDLVLDAALTGTIDDVAPVIITLLPARGAAVLSLLQAEVLFSEAVSGVDASDLLVNGVPATSLTFGVANQFIFHFPQPPTGAVVFAFAPSHGIVDQAVVPNAFAGDTWTNTLDPNLAAFDVRINEFMADNANGIRDEDASREDWIEIYNAGAASVSLTGWFLTDDAANLSKWRIPPGVQLGANGYLFIWASGKNRTNVGGLHTNFKLAPSGEFLGLVLPDSNTVVSSFAPVYPSQRADVSYGRDRLDPSIVGFYDVPTPGANNATSGKTGFAPDVTFSLASSTFVTPFNLTLSTTTTNAVIRYILVTNASQASASITNVPTTNSPIYTSAIPVTVTTEVRARAFQTGVLPGTPRTENYIQINSDVRNFSSDIPVCVMHVLGNGSIPATTLSGIMMAFDNNAGRSSVTNRPQMAARMGVHIRGSSTLNQPKSNFRVEFWDEFNQDNKLPLLGMPADSDWVLQGINGFDPGLMHNALYQWLGRQVGVFNMRTRFVELFRKVDGGPVTTNDYFGLYLLVETPKVGKDRTDIVKIQDQDTNSIAITGGYILKMDRVDNERSFRPPTIGSIRPPPQDIAFVDPPFKTTETDPRRLAQINYVQTYINTFLTNLSSASYTNPVTGYAQYINPEQWVNHLLANIIPFNVDGYRLSGYMYKDRSGRLEQGPMWDCDRCMGTGGTATPQGDNRAFSPRYWRLPANDVNADNGTDFFGISNVGVSWFTPLFRDPDFWQRFIDRYQSARTNEYSSNSVVGVLDGFYNTIKEAQVREQVRWGGTWQGTLQSFTYPRAGSQTVNGYTFDFGPADNNGRGRFTNEVNFQKRWMLDRFDFLDTNFLNMPTLSSGTALVPSGTMFTSAPAAKANSLLLYTLDGTDPRLPGGAVSSNARTNVGALTLTVTNNLRLFARSYNINHANMTNSGTEVGKPLINSFWSGPVAATYYTVVPSLRVTELMFHPADGSLTDTNDPDNYEYIELKNIGTNVLNLAGFKFINGIDFTFTASSTVTSLAPGEHVLVVKHLAAFTARYGVHTNVAGVYGGSFDNAGERVTLVGPLAEPILDFVYSDTWVPIADGAGFSLVIKDENAALNTWTNGASWRASTFEFGSPGLPNPAALDVPVVLINEALTHTDLPQIDTIELYNPGTNDANIGGWFLTDNATTPKKYEIPANTIIPAGGYLLFDESQFTNGVNGFSLSSNGDEVYLYSGTNGLLTGFSHGFDFGAAQNGQSFGRYVNSQGNEDFPAQLANTLGATNSLPLVGPVVVSEIFYHPPDYGSGANLVDNSDDEFIELHNLTTNAVPLYNQSFPTNTWRLSKAVTFSFPTNVSLAPTGFVVVVNFSPVTNAAQLAAFTAKFAVPPGTPIYGPYGGKLDNSGNNIHLTRPDAPNLNGSVPYILVDRVEHLDASPWPQLADGLGTSLQRLVPQDYGNDPTNWTDALPSPGRGFGGGTPPAITAPPADATAFLGGTTNFTVGASGSGLHYQWRFNGGAIPGATNSVLVITNLQYAQAGFYSAAVFNEAGSTVSSNATLTVITPVYFTLQPSSQLVLPGTNVTINSMAAGIGSITYQWRFEGTNLPGATNASYSFTGASVTNHHGNFSVVATDSFGSALSSNAFIFVAIKPGVSVPMRTNTVLQGASVTLSITATGAPPLTYRWLRNGAAFATNTVPMLTVTNVQVSARYQVVVTNLAGSSPSSPGAGITNLFVLADLDRDGVADLWELQYGFSTNNAADALLDFDGDGMNNRDEYLSGTNPTNALSVLKIVLSATNATELSFVAQTNLSYTVQWRTNLALPAWSNLTSITAQPLVRTVLVNSATAPAAPERYLRIVTPLVP